MAEAEKFLALEKRANQSDFTMAEVCREADIAYSTFWRAKMKGAKPKTYRELQSTLDKMIARSRKQQGSGG